MEINNLSDEKRVDDSSEDESCTPPEMRAKVESAKSDLLPKISRDKYHGVYLTFKEWRKSHNAKVVTENVLMAYFMELSEKWKPPTLWSTYSMLKTTLKTNDNLDIAKYLKLSAFLKRKSEGYKGKKSKVLTSSDVEKFLSEAPDEKFLATKVALIFGICGACRREELANIKLQDIQHQGDIMLIKIPYTKTKIQRSFIVDEEFSSVVAKYEALRPENVSSDRFFLNFQKGKCTSQVIGKNKLGKMPSDIAEYLKLPDASLYTGHTFRRTSATLLADSGADLTTLKRHGGWKSSTVAEGYIEDSTEYKRKIGNQIASTINMNASSSKVDVETGPNPAAKIPKRDDTKIEEKENNPAEGNALNIEDSDRRVTVININYSTVTITK